jgi:hypothetical protein
MKKHILIILAVTLFACNKDNQVITMTFDGNVNSCKPMSTKKTKAHLTIYNYNKRKNEGTVNIRIEGVNDEYVGQMIKPESGEKYRFKDANNGIGVVKDKKFTLMYQIPNCYYVFEGYKK